MCVPLQSKASAAKGVGSKYSMTCHGREAEYCSFDGDSFVALPPMNEARRALGF